LEVLSGDPVSLRWAQAFGPDCGKKGDILMVEVLFPPVTRRARNKNKSEMNRCLPVWLSRPTSHQPTSLVLALATHVVREFQVDLDELHNDSTTITFHGAYADAAQEEKRGQQTRLAITWGYNKDHRPDLKQLLYILTVARDGAVPLYFQVASGNVVDDKTHIATWDLLCRLVGRPNFLYVADCKLASSENMAYIHQHQGRFLTVLPR